MQTSRDITVAMIHPPTWENDGEIFTITDPIPADEWLEKVSGPGWQLETMPDDSLIAEGPYDGGHVIMVHNEEEDNTFLFAIPPEVIPLLQGLLPDQEYRTLVARTPKLSAMPVR
ncbi:MAG: hypothetical protein M3Q29_23085 [Chloroflexota bacterium]|nr:hypothetical protein [Chloroflexota bacterium]